MFTVAMRNDVAVSICALHVTNCFLFAFFHSLQISLISQNFAIKDGLRYGNAFALHTNASLLRDAGITKSPALCA
jgi:hypothetical protein